MIYPVAAILLLGFLLLRSGMLPRMTLKLRPDLLEKTASIGAVLAALLVLVRGNVWLALVLFGVALWLLGRASRGGATSARSGISRLRSATIEMDYDQRTGEMSGSVIAGAYEGRSLATFSRQTCGQIYTSALVDDPEGARLLEAYFDRRFAGWRDVERSDAHARPRQPSGSGGMSEDEAYEVLGLRRGATRDDVVRTHRRVMKKWHPDQGGSSALAARANEAKEVLLRRHG